MKNNIENIPSEVFDWLSSKSFDQLDSQQKLVVLQYITLEEYQELAHTTYEINKLMHPTQNNRIQSRERIMRTFDEVYSKPRQRFISSSFLRYAAIVILSIGLGYQLRFWLQPSTSNQVVFQPVVDTVYVHKESEAFNSTLPEYKDSIFSKVNSNTGSGVKRKYANKFVSEKKMNLNFNVVSVQEAKNMANIPKGNNCKSDSLRRKFVYVSL